MMDAARQKFSINQDQIIPITFAITDSEYMQKKASPQISTNKTCSHTIYLLNLNIS